MLSTPTLVSPSLLFFSRPYTCHQNSSPGAHCPFCRTQWPAPTVSCTCGLCSFHLSSLQGSCVFQWSAFFTPILAMLVVHVIITHFNWILGTLIKWEHFKKLPFLWKLSWMVCKHLMKMNLQKLCCFGVMTIKRRGENHKIQEELCTQIAL